MAQLSLFDLSRLFLLHEKNVFAAGKFLFPRLDFFFAGECVCLHNAVHNGCELGACSVEVGVAFEASNSQSSVVAVFFRLSGDGELGHLDRGLISFDDFAGATDVEGERVAEEDVVKLGVSSVAGATTVEALEANIQAMDVVLYC